MKNKHAYSGSTVACLTCILLGIDKRRLLRGVRERVGLLEGEEDENHPDKGEADLGSRRHTASLKAHQWFQVYSS